MCSKCCVEAVATGNVLFTETNYNCFDRNTCRSAKPVLDCLFTSLQVQCEQTLCVIELILANIFSMSGLIKYNKYLATNPLVKPAVIIYVFFKKTEQTDNKFLGKEVSSFKYFFNNFLCYLGT